MNWSQVEIRGLGSVAGSEWQSTELSAGGTGVAGAANNALSESRGMRYSKLDTWEAEYMDSDCW